MSAHKPPTRIAGTNVRGIDGVDGLPSTHTPLEPHHDRKGTTQLHESAPLPFGASHQSRLIVVGVMVGLVAVLTVVAIGSVVQANPGTVDLARNGLIGLLGWTGLLTAPALLSAAAACRNGRR